jgi:U6 snRNA-associated Sm-like protein LSm1
MENLSIADPPGPPSPQRLGQGQPSGPNAVFGGPPPQGAPQLPPQMFTTAAQLLDLTDSMYHVVYKALESGKPSQRSQGEPSNRA